MFDSALDMEDPRSKGELVIDTTTPPPLNDHEEEEEGSQRTASRPSTPSSPRQEPVGRNQEEEHFSVCIHYFIL